MSGEPSEHEVEKAYMFLVTAAEKQGYRLNPDREFTKALVRSLLINRQRYGYQACPCRLATGIREDDADILCPCYYRKPDVDEYGMCYCALYVSDAVYNGEKKSVPIPERRPETKEARDAFVKYKNK